MQQEKTNWRDLWFPSQWHRFPRFPKESLLMDIDAIEWRKDRNGFYKPAGFFEYKKMWQFREVIDYIKEKDQLFWQLYLLKEVARCCDSIAYFVGYEYGDQPYSITEVRLFNISDWQKGDIPKVDHLSIWEYEEWIKKLRIR